MGSSSAGRAIKLNMNVPLQPHPHAIQGRVVLVRACGSAVSERAGEHHTIQTSTVSLPRLRYTGISSIACLLSQEWDAASGPAWDSLVAEAEEIAAAESGCWGHPPHKIKDGLDAQWIAKANAHLGQHGLKVKTYGFYSRNGTGYRKPHVMLQFFTLKD